MISRAFEQIDVDISEDGREVIFLGWTTDDRTFIATVPLASMLDRGLVSKEQWQQAAPPFNEFRSMEG